MGRSHSRKIVSLGGSLRVAALPPGALDATPERLRHALRDGAVREEAGTRRLADPFDKLHAGQNLDRQSRERNTLLFEAGLRFRRHWHGGRIDGLTAFDFSRESVDGGAGPGATTPTEAALRHRTSYRNAMEAVGGRLIPYLTGVVIDGAPAKNLCHLVTETGHARTAEAIVQERLREALHRLVEHWGMAGARQRPPGSALQHLARVQDV